MRKLGQKGISRVQSVIVFVVVLALAGAGAYLLFIKPAAKEVSVTVRLHDAETIDLSQLAQEYMPELPFGISVSVSGTVTINSFSATNVTVRLHNKDTGEWATIVENQIVTDLTVETISSRTFPWELMTKFPCT